jgi:hypothetical protein
MFKHFKALGIAGLTTLGASQLAVAGPNSVLWSQNKERAEVNVAEAETAARAISRWSEERPLVRFTGHQAGDSAVVPLWPAEDNGRCSPDFDLAPFVAEKGHEVWVNFEFVNIDRSDVDLLAFAIKADKPGRKDRYRVDHEIGHGRLGNKLKMTAMMAPPTEGDYGYYFLDRGILKTDELLCASPGAAIKITLSSHARGPEV